MIGTNGFTEAVNIKTSIESAVWRYDTYTGQIQPQWVNTDGSFPNTTLAYDSTEKAFILTGDVYVYQAQTGSTVSPVVRVASAVTHNPADVLSLVDLYLRGF